MNWQPPRGTRDLLPEDMAVRNELYGKFRRTFELYGYGMVETPAFEDFALLAKKSGEEIENEIYAFEDKGGRKLGLRFDPTVPICRIVASNNALAKPVKLSYITRMWRYDRPQAGRYREFWQAGCELIGPSGIEADVEILQIVSDLIKAAGVKEFYFKINSRKLVERIVKEVGIPEKKVSDVLRSIDKLDKIGKDGVKKELKEKDVREEQMDKLLDFIGEDSPFMLMVQAGKVTVDKNNEERVDEWEELVELEQIIQMAKEVGIENIKLDFSIVRGIDYYTGFVFETFVKGKENLGSVCSGGRYDTLVKVYGGQDLPAVGFGLGVDRLLDVTGVKPTMEPVYAFVASVNDDVRKEVRDVARMLRGLGISCEIDLMNREFSKQMKYANTKKIPYVVIVGPEELRRTQVKLKNMETGKEALVKIEDLPKKLG